MKVLVTGARGFVGSAIVEKLRRYGIEVIELHSRRLDKKAKEELCNKQTVQADITDKDEVLGLKNIGKIDAIIHAAGLAHQLNGAAAKDFKLVNVTGTENILELGEKLQIKKFILISSVSVYGNNNEVEFKLPGTTEDDRCCPKDFYAESKYEAENKAQKFSLDAGFDLTILRPATVIGEGDRGNFLRLIKSIDKRRFIWIGKGSNYKSLIHREDVAEAVCKILLFNTTEKTTEKTKRADKTEIFNIAAEPLPMKEIVGVIYRALDKNAFDFSINEKLLNAFFAFNSAVLRINKIEKNRQMVDKWLGNDAYSGEKLSRIYQPKITVEKAIKREVIWYLSIQ